MVPFEGMPPKCGLRYEPEWKPYVLFEDNIEAELKKRLENDLEYQKLRRKHQIQIYQEQIDLYDKMQPKRDEVLKILNNLKSPAATQETKSDDI